MIDFLVRDFFYPPSSPIQADIGDYAFWLIKPLNLSKKVIDVNVLGCHGSFSLGIKSFYLTCCKIPNSSPSDIYEIHIHVAQNFTAAPNEPASK